ncbi:RNA polymerase sigma factor [bacterium]|nr:RNA polymerase sigma factor [bacterium]
MERSKELLFEKIYDSFSKEIFNVIYSYVLNKYDSEDLLQDTFISFLDKFPSFENLVEYKYFLIRIAINKSINFIKKNSKTTTLKDDYIIKSYDNYCDLENSKIIFDSVISLPEKLKIVIVLYYYNDLKIKEIAKTLKIGESAVKMRLKRGQEELRNKIGGIL